MRREPRVPLNMFQAMDLAKKQFAENEREQSDCQRSRSIAAFDKALTEESNEPEQDELKSSRSIEAFDKTLAEEGYQQSPQPIYRPKKSIREEFEECLAEAIAEDHGRKVPVDGSPSPAPRVYLKKVLEETGNKRHTFLHQYLSSVDDVPEPPLNGPFHTKNHAPESPDPAWTNRFSPLPPVEFTSPNKWQLDDFTAGDLQVSDSPRINDVKTKTSDGTDHTSPRADYTSPRADYTSPRADYTSPRADYTSPRADYTSPRADYTSPRADYTSPRTDRTSTARLTIPRRNNRLNEIQEREKAAMSLSLADTINEMSSLSARLNKPNDRLDQLRERVLNQEKKEKKEAAATLEAPKPFVIKRTNTKLDEIKAREDALNSKSAIARAKMEEIKAKNAAWVPPAWCADRYDDYNDENLRGGSLNSETARSARICPSIPIRGTPVTVFRNNSYDEWAEWDRQENEKASIREFSTKSEPLSGEAEFDLLRRLAQATSNSPPASESADAPDAPPLDEDGDTSQQPSMPDNKRPEKLEAKNSKARLTVGFAVLPKNLSSDSLAQKISDSDPTDRIEAEMNLFAPQDNYSEKGSTRAPSPDPSESSEPNNNPAETMTEIVEEIAEETPRPKRTVDTLTQPTPRITGAYVETPATVKVERREDSPDQATKAQVVVKVEDAGRRSRPKILRRHGPLSNTAKIPSVKEDLCTILRQHRIDDSTLDNFDEFLDNDFEHEELEKMVTDTVTKLEKEFDSLGLDDREREQQTWDRMSKSLKTGLLNIRSAKQGIERLEDKVAHSEHKASTPKPVTDSGPSVSSTYPLTVSDNGICITLPPLYRHQPHFRLTPFGILTFLLATWYIIESAFCFLYVMPSDACAPYLCDWSPHEPYFPYAAPFMIDEWTTGGQGRDWAWWLGDEIGDVWADMSDWVTGHDFTKDNQLYMDAWQRKRQKRRLRKKGLNWKWVEPPGMKEQVQKWKEEAAARERMEKLMEEGRDEGDENESMSADEEL